MKHEDLEPFGPAILINPFIGEFNPQKVFSQKCYECSDEFLKNVVKKSKPVNGLPRMVFNPDKCKRTIFFPEYCGFPELIGFMSVEKILGVIEDLRKKGSFNNSLSVVVGYLLHEDGHPREVGFTYEVASDKMHCFCRGISSLIEGRILLS